MISQKNRESSATTFCPLAVSSSRWKRPNLLVTCLLVLAPFLSRIAPILQTTLQHLNIQRSILSRLIKWNKEKWWTAKKSTCQGVKPHVIWPKGPSWCLMFWQVDFMEVDHFSVYRQNCKLTKWLSTLESTTAVAKRAHGTFYRAYLIGRADPVEQWWAGAFWA